MYTRRYRNKLYTLRDLLLCSCMARTSLANETWRHAMHARCVQMGGAYDATCSLRHHVKPWSASSTSRLQVILSQGTLGAQTSRNRCVVIFENTIVSVMKHKTGYISHMCIVFVETDAHVSWARFLFMCFPSFQHDPMRPHELDRPARL